MDLIKQNCINLINLGYSDILWDDNVSFVTNFKSIIDDFTHNHRKLYKVAYTSVYPYSNIGRDAIVIEYYDKSESELLCLKKILESIDNISRINDESISEITTLLHNVITDYDRSKLYDIDSSVFNTKSEAEQYVSYITRYNYYKFVLRECVVVAIATPLIAVSIPIACICHYFKLC